MIGGGDAKESTLFTMDSCQWLTVPQRIPAGRRAHVARAEEDGKDSIEEAAVVVRTVQPRCVCVGERPRPWCAKCNHGACVGRRA
jgi:hypothetical protein